MSDRSEQAVQYQVVHDTVYNYAYLVANGQHYTHLTPRHTAHQQVISHTLEFDPEPSESSMSLDYFGNHCQSLLIQSPHDRLRVTASTRVSVQPIQLPVDFGQQPWECALAPPLHTPEPLEVADMRLASPLVPILPASVVYVQRCLTVGRPWLEALLDLTRLIHTEFTYDTEATLVDTPLGDVFANRAGVCQDFAHVMLSCLRSCKLPARYVSGYILNEPMPGHEKLIGSDASHAWVESWLPGFGWVGFDPTNGKLANNEFITIAWGRDYGDVAPLRGVVLGGGEHELEVSVTVSKVA